MIKILVPVSGGKDSQSCLKLALQHQDRSLVRGLFCDTQFEHPLTYKHIDWMRKHYNVEIDVVTGGSVLEKTLKYKRFPGGGARHCTDELKIRETRIYCKELAEKQGEGFEVWYGMRSDESSQRKKRYEDKLDTDLYPPHEVLPRKYPKYLSEKLGVYFRLPILNWTSENVLNFLAGEENPLYKEGFNRVGCFPCLAAGDQYKRKAFEHDAFGKEQYIKVIEVGKKINKDIWTSKKEKLQGCLICEI